MFKKTLFNTIALMIQVTERENDQNIKSLKIQKKIQYSECLHVGTYYLSSYISVLIIVYMFPCFGLLGLL